MSKGSTFWDGVDPRELRVLLAHAPVRALVLSGDELTVDLADPDLVGSLFPGMGVGERARSMLAATLGEEWVGRIDRVRSTGVAEGGPAKGESSLWDVWVTRVPDGRVVLYASELGAGARGRELLHALRNPIYGIRAAVKILLRRDLDDATREVLTEVDQAAAQAQSCVQELDRPR